MSLHPTMAAARTRAEAVTQSRLHELLSYDPSTGLFVRKLALPGYSAGSIAGSTTKKGYVLVMVDDISYKAHRLAWMYVLGEWPEGQIDHKNGDKSDNRIENLRVVTNKQNCENIGPHRDNASGYRGVSWDKQAKKFRAQITHNYKKLNIGRFSTAEAAHSAYAQVAATLHTHSPFAGKEQS